MSTPLTAPATTIRPASSYTVDRLVPSGGSALITSPVRYGIVSPTICAAIASSVETIT